MWNLYCSGKQPQHFKVTENDFDFPYDRQEQTRILDKMQEDMEEENFPTQENDFKMEFEN